jgi:hypothetical protein
MQGEAEDLGGSGRNQLGRVKMGMEVITVDDLFETSTKKRCEVARQHFIEAGRVEEYDNVRRHPDTCASRVFSLQEADELWSTRFQVQSLLSDMGMGIYSLGDPLDTKVVFLTDDTNYGWKVLKEAGWGAMSFKFRGTSHREFNTWREHIDHYYGACVKVVESEEDLLLVLNGRFEEVAG